MNVACATQCKRISKGRCKRIGGGTKPTVVEEPSTSATIGPKTSTLMSRVFWLTSTNDYATTTRHQTDIEYAAIYLSPRENDFYIV